MLCQIEDRFQCSLSAIGDQMHLKPIVWNRNFCPDRHRLELMRQIYYNYFVEPSKNDQLLQCLTIAAQKLRSPVLIEDRSILFKILFVYFSINY